MKIHVIFQPRLADQGRAPNDLVFVEVNDEHGKSINAGEWIADGEHEALVIDCAKLCSDNPLRDADTIAPSLEHTKELLSDWATRQSDALNTTTDPATPPMLSHSRITELYHYASSYETFDENTPNGTPCQHGGDAMNDERRAAIITYKKVLGLLPEDYQS